VAEYDIGLLGGIGRSISSEVGISIPHPQHKRGDVFNTELIPNPNGDRFRVRVTLTCGAPPEAITVPLSGVRGG
jgi:hypothetical protein